MELWSVGRHVLVVIVTIGWQLWLVQSQLLPEPGSSIGQASAPKSPSAAVRAVAAAADAAAAAAGLSGPAIGLPAAAADAGLPEAACGVPPATCVFNTTVPHYHNCRKYRVCGFTNNWQSRTCRRGQNFDRATLQCRPAAEAQCAECPGPTKGPTTLGLARRTTRPSTTKPPGFGSRPRRTTPWTPRQAGTITPRSGSPTDEACRTNFAAPCLNRSATIADPANCSRYMECDHDQWISRNCAIGTHFDKVIKRCLYPKDASCQPPCPRVECDLGAQCMPGWHVGDPTDCGKYYTCGGPPAGGGSPWGHRQCPIDKPFFDAVTLGCVTKTANCAAPCNISASAPTPPSTVSNNSTTTTASSTQLTGKDITLKMPLAELCNSPYRTDHSSCSISSNGFIHRHPTNCRKYFLCVGNRWMPGACPDLQFWSISNASCVPQGSMVCVSFQCDPQGQNQTLTTTTVPTTITTTTTSIPTAATSPTTAPTSTTPFITTENLTTLSTDTTTTPRITTPTTPKATFSTTTTTTSSTPSMMTPDSTSRSTSGSTTSSTRTTSSSTPTPSTRSSAKTSTQTATVVTTTGTTNDSAPSLSSGTTVTNTTAVKPTTTSENNITHTVSTLQINNTLSTVSTISVESSSSMSVPSIPVTFEPTPSSPVASATSASPTPMSATNMTSAAWLTSSTSQTSPSSPEVTSSATPASPSPSSTTTSNTSTSQVPTSISAPATSAPSKSSTTSTMSTVSATAVTSPHTSVVDSTSTVSSMNAVTNTSDVERTSTAESITHTSAVPTVTMTVGTSPTATTPPVSTAPLTTPTVATPTVTTSNTTTPTVSSPTVTSPILTSSTVTTATVTTPPVTSSTVTTATVTTPPVTSPPETSQTVTTPTVTTPTVTSPTIASPTVTNVTNTSHHSSVPTSYPATPTPTSLHATKPANVTNTAPSTMSLASTAQPGSPQGNGTTQSVDSQSTKHSTESTQRHLPTSTEVLPVRCLEEQVGLQVWPEIEQGTTVQGICPAPKTGLSVRRCVWEAGVGAMWQLPDYQLCVDPKYDELLESVEALDPTTDQEPKPPKHALRRTIMKLASLTKTSLAKPTGIRGGNLNASLQAIDSITQVVQNHQLTLTVDITTALFNIVGNFLSPKNKRGWSAVREQDPSRGVTVLMVVDRIGRQMAQNSMSNPMTSSTTGLSIRAEMRHKDDLQTFDYTPDPPPGSRPDPTGIRDRVILDKKSLEAVKKELSGDMVAVWSTYYHTLNNILPVKGDDFLNSHVLSVSVQGLPNGRVLRPTVRLHFASLNHSVSDTETHCAFWEFSLTNRGRWSVDGCKIVRSDLSGTICECEHLTNFAILLSPSPASGIHTTILSIISVVGSLLSILGMLVTICLYILSWKRVKSHHAAVLMNLCIALIIANITFLAGVDRTENKLVCTVVAGMLHFFYLVAFFMMFADGIQFILYVVQVFHVRRKKDTFLLVLTCWVIPAAIVATSLGITRGEGYGTEDYCWLRKDTGLIAAFAVPAIIVIIANFVILCKILHTISNSKGSERNNRVKATIWNIAVMMPLLGLTWVFGLFSVNDKTVYFQYIFCICNSLQGFFIFFFHCALNKKMRQAVIERFSSRSSQSSSMRKSGGSNKSDKKKGNGKLSKKPDKYKSKKKPTISPPKLQGRKPEYIAPRHQVAAPNMYPPTSIHGNHQMAPPTGDPAQNPDTQYMDLEEAKMAVCIARVDASPPPQYPGPLRLSQYDPGEDPVHGPVYGRAHSPGSSYGPMHSPVYRSVDRPPRSGLPRQDQHVQRELDSFRSQERQNYECDLALTCYPQDHDMDHIDLNFTSSERSIRRGQPDNFSWVPACGADQPRPWWFGGPHTNQSFKHSMSMEDLRHLDDPCVAPGNNGTATSNNSPWMAVEQEDEDPYLLPLSHHLGVPPESAPDTDWLSATFDPRKGSHQTPLHMAQYHRLGNQSLSLDRLDRWTWLDRRELPKRQKGISASSMKRFASKERGGAFIVMHPQHLYENVVQGGDSSEDIREDPLYMQIDDVTMDVDSPASALDYMAGHA